MKKGVFMLIIGKLNELGKRSTDVIGTVWKDSEALPKDVLNAKLNKGETKTTNLPHYNTMCMQWKDNHDVHMLSSCIPDGNVSVMWRGKEVVIMGGVDWSDQMMNLYPAEHKRIKNSAK